MRLGINYKIIRTVALAFIGSAGAYGLYSNYESSSPTIRVLEGNSESSANYIKAIVSCESLESLVIKNMKKIIKQGQFPKHTDPVYQNFSSNLSAMKLHKCDKAALYTYLNNTLTMDDSLYFELNEIL